MANSIFYIDRLQAATKKWAKLSPAQWENFRSLFKIRHYEAREFVAKPGLKAHQVYFVAEGLVRFYYVEDEGDESDRLFCAEGSFARAVTAALLGHPYGAQAIEASVVLKADWDALSRLFATDPAFGEFTRKLTESMLAHKDRHIWSLQNLTASERYLDFLERFPGLSERVPQYHIAKYLGMSEVSLSRLKKSLS